MPTVYVYPTDEQKERWNARAADLNMSNSEFVQSMVEAGQKKFDATVELDEDIHDLREDRNDLKRELDRARNRIDRLRTKLSRGERRAIESYVEANHGASFEEIVQHLIESVPQRANMHLDTLEGEKLTRGPEDELYYPIQEDGAEAGE